MGIRFDGISMIKQSLSPKLNHHDLVKCLAGCVKLLPPLPLRVEDLISISKEISIFYQ